MTKEILVLLGIILLSQASKQMSHGYLQQFFSPSFHTEGLFHVGCQEPGNAWSTCKSKGPTESAFSCWRLNHVVFTWRLLHGFYYIWMSVAYIRYPVDMFIFSKNFLRGAYSPFSSRQLRAAALWIILILSAYLFFSALFGTLACSRAIFLNICLLMTNFSEN